MINLRSLPFSGHASLFLATGDEGFDNTLCHLRSMDRWDNAELLYPHSSLCSNLFLHAITDTADETWPVLGAGSSQKMSANRFSYSLN